MKILGILLILGALVGGGILLPPTIQEYVNHGQVVTEQQEEAARGLRELERAKAAPPSPDGDVRLLWKMESVEGTLRIVGEAKEIRARKLREGGIMIACGLALVAAGVWLIRRGGRRPVVVETA